MKSLVNEVVVICTNSDSMAQILNIEVSAYVRERWGKPCNDWLMGMSAELLPAPMFLT